MALRHKSLLCLALAAITATTSSTAFSQTTDPWFGPDKAKHFGASGLIAAAGYTVGTYSFDARYEAVLLGSGLALSAGIGKEALDAAGYGTPSWRDLTWDVVGTLVGTGAAWGIDLLLRGTGESRPWLASPQSKKAGLVVVAF